MTTCFMKVVASAVMSMSAEVTTARARLQELIQRRDDIERELMEGGRHHEVVDNMETKDDNANNQMRNKASVTRQSSLPAKLHQTNANQVGKSPFISA